jgi:hypothetical protein
MVTCQPVPGEGAYSSALRGVNAALEMIGRTGNGLYREAQLEGLSLLVNLYDRSCKNPAYLPSYPILSKNLAGAYFYIEILGVEVFCYLPARLPACPPAA